jgi:hypothetical protein
VGHCDCGRGVFAERAFSPGDAILIFEGPHISLAQTLAMGDDHVNALQIDENCYIDLLPPAVFVNHSCAPNAAVVNDVVLTAIRPIGMGEEVRFDYSTTMLDGTVAMACLCGSPSCRGVIGDFTGLPSELQAEYLRLGLVQRFIADRLRASVCVLNSREHS